jgi:hypothetical protein
MCHAATPAGPEVSDAMSRDHIAWAANSALEPTAHLEESRNALRLSADVSRIKSRSRFSRFVGAAGVNRVNIVSAVNRRIRDFVCQRANVNLLPGTGYYSTPFRGSLFGQVESAAVMKQLPSRGVDVLWLGTNPCVPRSLEYIMNPPESRGDFPGFEKQMESGLFGSSRWEANGEPSPDWNPIERPTRSWQVYRDVLSGIARLECVAMANFIPWGSQNTEALVKGLGTTNRALLVRVLEFADDLNSEIVQALAPRLVVVPFSLGRSSRLDVVRPLGLTLKQAIDAKRHTIPLPEGTFNCYTGNCRRGKVTVRTVFLRHPASLRLSREARKRVVGALTRILDAGQ